LAGWIVNINGATVCGGVPLAGWIVNIDGATICGEGVMLRLVDMLYVYNMYTNLEKFN